MSKELDNILALAKCTVISCPNYLQTSSSNQFFSFPPDPQISNLWKQKCGVAEHYPTTHAKVCAKHFKESDYEDYNILKPTAIPRENLDWMIGKPEVKLTLSKTNNELKEAKRLNTELEEQLKEKIELQRTVSQELELYKTKIYHVEGELTRLRKLIEQCGIVRKGKVCENLISTVFSPAQIKMLMGKRKVLWSRDDMAMAFALRHVGNRALYLYLKNVLNFPLPALGAVQRMLCAILGCPNARPSTSDPTVHYNFFPGDLPTAEKWKSVCGYSPEKINTKTAQVCSRHFSEDCYVIQLTIINCIPCYTKILKSGVVPNLNLPQIFDTENEIIAVIKTDKDPLTTETRNLEELKRLENVNEHLKQKLLKIDVAIEKMKYSINQTMEIYKNKEMELGQLHEDYLKSKRVSMSLQQQKDLLGKVFSDSQIKLLCGKRRIYWSNDDMAVAYTIRHLSNRRCYNYLCKNLKIPLPAVSSVKRWLTLEEKTSTHLNNVKENNEEVG